MCKWIRYSMARNQTKKMMMIRRIHKQWRLIEVMRYSWVSKRMARCEMKAEKSKTWQTRSMFREKKDRKLKILNLKCVKMSTSLESRTRKAQVWQPTWRFDEKNFRMSWKIEGERERTVCNFLDTLFLFFGFFRLMKVVLRPSARSLSNRQLL